MLPHRCRYARAAIVLACLAAPLHAASVKPPRDTLWRLVDGRCAPAAEHGIYPPAPCTEVVREPGARRGYAVLKDRAGRYQYLTIPLSRISGIESPALLEPDAFNYFAAAWRVRLYTEAALHRSLPRGDVILMVNSAHGRSQDQLHIHVDCIRPDVWHALAQAIPTLTTQWRPLPARLPPNRHRYQARWVGGEALTLNPFKDLAASLAPGDSMAMHSLAVVGARSPDGAPGFVLLSGHVDPASDDRGSGDELLDHRCAIANADEASRKSALP